MNAANPLVVTGFFILLAAVPLAALGLTSFLKLSVVFGVLRSAIGAGQIPSVAITSLLSLALSAHIMTPVAMEIYAAARPYLSASSGAKDRTDPEYWLQAASVLSAPLKRFLAKHSRPEEISFFFGVEQRNSPTPQSVPNASASSEVSFGVLVPSFVLSELREAFAIGFSLFLPFLVVDLVVASVLSGLGMMMVSPATISLPLKLLLFVGCDGWFLLSRSLVTGYL